MPVQKITKEEIILKSLDVFRQQGYHNTSMSDLAKSCGLFKGSFYYYFESKEMLMHSVLEFIKHFLHENVYSIAYHESLLPEEKLGKMLRKLGKVLLRSDGGCIIGNTTLETARIIPEFRSILQEIFTEWIEAHTFIYKANHDEIMAQKLALQTVMEFEGAVMLSKLYDNQDFYADCFERAMMRLSPNQ